MRKLGLFAGLLAGCASAPRSEFVDQALFRGYTLPEVRETARLVLEEKEIAPCDHVVRAWNDRVVTDGRIGVCGRDVACGGGAATLNRTTGTPWTTIEVRLQDRGEDTAVRVDIEYVSRSHCTMSSLYLTCFPEQLGSLGFLERRIIERIRARLTSDPE